MKQVAIAKLLKRSHTTIAREIKRNTGKKGYRPKQANDLATARRLTAKKHVKLTPEIRQELSPEQVYNYLEAQGKTKLHHETIYRLLLEDKHAGETLYKHLRHLHKSHRKCYGSYERRGRIKNAVSIEQRQSVVDSRSRIDDWGVIQLLVKIKRVPSTHWLIGKAFILSLLSLIARILLS
jgi:IS30 family transposase